MIHNDIHADMDRVEQAGRRVEDAQKDHWAEKINFVDRHREFEPGDEAIVNTGHPAHNGKTFVVAECFVKKFKGRWTFFYRGPLLDAYGAPMGKIGERRDPVFPNEGR